VAIFLVYKYTQGKCVISLEVLRNLQGSKYFLEVYIKSQRKHISLEIYVNHQENYIFLDGFIFGTQRNSQPSRQFRIMVMFGDRGNKSLCVLWMTFSLFRIGSWIGFVITTSSTQSCWIVIIWFDSSSRGWRRILCPLSKENCNSIYNNSEL
jgi:hypothetical protein